MPLPNALKPLAVFVAIFALPVFSSQSAPLTPPYTGDYFATSAQTNGTPHSAWFQGITGSDYFQFVDTGLFSWPGSVPGDTATLSGTILQNGTADNKFIVDVTLDFLGVGVAPPKCENNACVDNDESQWAQFNMTAGTLTGTDGFDGLIIELAQMGPPAQLGYGANGKNPSSDFGMSWWWTWEITQNTNNIDLGKMSGRGDFNLVLKPVPIPAALPLFVSGLGAIGFFGWRRKRQIESA